MDRSIENLIETGPHRCASVRLFFGCGFCPGVKNSSECDKIATPSPDFSGKIQSVIRCCGTAEPAALQAREANRFCLRTPILE